MKNILILLSGILIHFLNAAGQDRWTVDNAHSSVRFTVQHMLISEVEGSFRSFTGTILAANPDFTDARIDFSVDVNSINTDNDRRDNHLKSPDFFDAQKFPAMTFKSTAFKKLSGNKYQLAGNLTIRDVTKPTTFDVTYGGTIKDPMGKTRAGFKATTVISRSAFGLKWNNLTETGGAVVGDDVHITLNLEFIKG
jgi:polyisoprenoid-binding protein YceI